MQIVTIARELGATDYEQEAKLCRAIGLRFVHRESLEDHFRSLGTDTQYIHRFDERKPRVVDSFLNRPDIYFETLRTAILQEVTQGSVAIIGRGANFLLNSMLDCLRLRFIAPLDIRAERIAGKLGCSREQALTYARKSDHERIGFCYYFYGKKWQDANAYDLTVNTAEINPADLEEVINKLSSLKKVTPEQELQFPNILLKQLICHTILTTDSLSIRCLEIDCRDGHVVLHGLVPSRGMSERVESIVRKVNGVLSVQNQLKVVLKDIPKRRE